MRIETRNWGFEMVAGTGPILTKYRCKVCKANGQKVAIFGDGSGLNSGGGYQGHQPADVGRRQFVWPQADDPPVPLSRLKP